MVFLIIPSQQSNICAGNGFYEDLWGISGYWSFIQLTVVFHETRRLPGVFCGLSKGWHDFP